MSRCSNRVELTTMYKITMNLGKDLVAASCALGLACFALRIEAVESLLQSLFGAFAGIDCAAPDRRHHEGRSPKKRGPFHLVPAMAVAAAVRLRKVWPSHLNPPSTTSTVTS